MNPTNPETARILYQNAISAKEGKLNPASRELGASPIHVQRKICLHWVNSLLKPYNHHVQCLRTDFADGVSLLVLLEALSGDDSIRKNAIPSPKVKAEKVNNLYIAFKWIHTNYHIVNISLEDILDRNEKQILGLLWRLIDAYQLHVIRSFLASDDCLIHGNDQPSFGVQVLPLEELESHLFKLAKMFLDKEPWLDMWSMSSLLEDPRLFFSLLHRTDNKYFRSQMASMSKSLTYSTEQEKARKHANEAFELLEEQFGVPNLLNCVDESEGALEERAWKLTYLAECMKRLQVKQRLRKELIQLARSYQVSGQCLQAPGVRAGETAVVYIVSTNRFWDGDGSSPAASPLRQSIRLQDTLDVSSSSVEDQETCKEQLLQSLDDLFEREGENEQESSQDSILQEQSEDADDGDYVDTPAKETDITRFAITISPPYVFRANQEESDLKFTVSRGLNNDEGYKLLLTVPAECPGVYQLDISADGIQPLEGSPFNCYFNSRTNMDDVEVQPQQLEEDLTDDRAITYTSPAAFQILSDGLRCRDTDALLALLDQGECALQWDLCGIDLGFSLLKAGAGSYQYEFLKALPDKEDSVGGVLTLVQLSFLRSLRSSWIGLHSPRSLGLDLARENNHLAHLIDRNQLLVDVRIGSSLDKEKNGDASHNWDTMPFTASVLLKITSLTTAFVCASIPGGTIFEQERWNGLRSFIAAKDMEIELSPLATVSVQVPCMILNPSGQPGANPVRITPLILRNDGGIFENQHKLQEFIEFGDARIATHDESTYPKLQTMSFSPEDCIERMLDCIDGIEVSHIPAAALLLSQYDGEHSIMSEEAAQRLVRRLLVLCHNPATSMEISPSVLTANAIEQMRQCNLSDTLNNVSFSDCSQQQAVVALRIILEENKKVERTAQSDLGDGSASVDSATPLTMLSASKQEEREMSSSERNLAENIPVVGSNKKQNSASSSWRNRFSMQFNHARTSLPRIQISSSNIRKHFSVPKPLHVRRETLATPFLVPAGAAYLACTSVRDHLTAARSSVRTRGRSRSPSSPSRGATSSPSSRSRSPRPTSPDMVCSICSKRPRLAEGSLTCAECFMLLDRNRNFTFDLSELFYFNGADALSKKRMGSRRDYRWVYRHGELGRRGANSFLAVILGTFENGVDGYGPLIALVSRLRSMNANVVVVPNACFKVAKTVELLNNTLKETSKKDGFVDVIPADLYDLSCACRLFDHIKKTYGAVHMLINGAHVFGASYPLSESEKDGCVSRLSEIPEPNVGIHVSRTQFVISGEDILGKIDCISRADSSCLRDAIRMQKGLTLAVPVARMAIEKLIMEDRRDSFPVFVVNLATNCGFTHSSCNKTADGIVNNAMHSLTRGYHQSCADNAVFMNSVIPFTSRRDRQRITDRDAAGMMIHPLLIMLKSRVSTTAVAQSLKKRRSTYSSNFSLPHGQMLRYYRKLDV